jgi:hypothetical protein
MCTERCIFKITIFWMLRRVVSYINTNFGVSCRQKWNGLMIITATDSSESLVNIYKTTRRHIPRHSAMIHSVSRQPLTVESQVPSHAIAYEIYGGKVGNGTGFPSKNFSFSTISAILPIIQTHSSTTAAI